MTQRGHHPSRRAPLWMGQNREPQMPIEGAELGLCPRIGPCPCSGCPQHQSCPVCTGAESGSRMGAGGGSQRWCCGTSSCAWPGAPVAGSPWGPLAARQLSVPRAPLFTGTGSGNELCSVRLLASLSPGQPGEGEGGCPGFLLPSSGAGNGPCLSLSPAGTVPQEWGGPGLLVRRGTHSPPGTDQRLGATPVVSPQCDIGLLMAWPGIRDP